MSRTLLVPTRAWRAASFAVLVCSTGMSVRLAQAQSVSPNCSTSPAIVGNAADICRKAADLFSYIVPQIGVALAGGNAVLGEGGTLGGWGKRSVSLRVTAVNGSLPKSAVPITTGGSSATADDFGAAFTFVPMASLDAAIGMFEGLPLGLTNFGGVDVLLGAVQIPRVREGSFNMASAGASYAISYGARVGLLQESSLVPGISISYMRRKVPTLNVQYTPGNDTLNVNNFSLTANALRAVISKRFLLFGLSAGVGRDEIRGVTGVNAVVNETRVNVSTRTAITFPTFNEAVTRNSVFANASFGLFAARVVAEFGRSSAGTLRETLNTFGTHHANEAYSYESLGVTVRF